MYGCSRLISFVEFQAFEALLASPDAMYALAFQLFDTNSSGYVTYGMVICGYISCFKHMLRKPVLSIKSNGCF